MIAWRMFWLRERLCCSVLETRRPETKIEKEMRLQNEREKAKLGKENEKVWKEMAKPEGEINSPSSFGSDDEDE